MVCPYLAMLRELNKMNGCSFQAEPLLETEAWAMFHLPATSPEGERHRGGQGGLPGSPWSQILSGSWAELGLAVLCSALAQAVSGIPLTPYAKAPSPLAFSPNPEVGGF